MFNYILIIVLVLVLFYYTRTEGFQNRDEKAFSIYEWFTQNPRAGYSKYRSDLNEQSNIVEYEDVRQLFEEKNFTVSNIKDVI